MKKGYNVIMEDADIRRVEDAVPGAKGGTAIRVAALMYARTACSDERGDGSSANGDSSSDGEGSAS